MKDYKKILEGVVNIINTTEKSDIVFANICSYVGENCPELKESEDEKIREEIIQIFKGQIPYTSEESAKKYIAWLEKQKVLTTEEDLQGKEDVLWCIKQAKKYAKNENEMGTCWFAEKWLEKQGQVNETIISQHENKICKENNDSLTSEDEKIRKDIKQHLLYLDDSFPDKAKWLAWLEKQGEQNLIMAKSPQLGEQNPADKVEPIFEVGDWVVVDGVTQQVTQIRPEGFDTDRAWNGKLTFKDVHLWTIQDAKDGDVLFQDLMGGKTFIYNGINPDMAILYSFIISNDGEDVFPYHIGKPNTGIGYIEENKNIIYPATKEQRDLLFSKIKEAGYEWDADKKELKKIEQQPAWSEEDKVNLEKAIWYVENPAPMVVKDSMLVEWLRSLKERITKKIEL